MNLKKICIQLLLFVTLFIAWQPCKLFAQVNTNNFITRPWSLFFLNENTGFVVGWNLNNGGEIWKTINGGDAWSKLLSGDQEYFYRLFAFNENELIVTGSNGKILKTTDAGYTWNNYSYPTYSGLADICFPNASTGYIAGGDFFPNPVFIKTTNSGVTWINMPHDSLFDLGAVKFIDEKTGYAGGNRIVMKTTDGGKTYTEYFDDEFNISCIDILDTSKAYLSGGSNYGGGFIAKTENSGKSWSIIYRSEEAVQVKKIRSLDNLTAIAITSDAIGGILKTIDGGNNWDIFKLNKVETLTDICFINGNMGWITGRKDGQGFLYKTTNKGDHWTLQVGTIQIPVNFSLSQNYPNPFNPKTVIKYDIAISGMVKLEVYDLLGRLVKSLVSNYQEPGTYSIDFDGTSLTSGIYIYKIETGSFNDTKRMVLLK